MLEELKQSKTVSLGGDMRADSPGHCVKYGSYSMMDLSTNTIVDIQLVQSNEVGSSVRMANEGLIQSLEFLERSGVKVKPDIDHFYVWHLSLTKKVDAISKEKGCNKIKMWKEGIKASTEETVAKWISLLNHIQNVHVHENPLFPKCLHPPSADKNKWVKPGTPLFNRNYVILLESCNIQYSQLLCTHHILCISYSLSPSSNKGHLQAGECANEQLTDLLFNEVIHDPAPFVAEMKAVVVPGFLYAIASYVSRFSCPGWVGTAPTHGDPHPSNSTIPFLINQLFSANM
uniref:Uncharacterized protein n=1 Tax=Sinocyclocheilus grahami TaxID=75366 RepID=A0A672JS93_SINGR